MKPNLAHGFGTDHPTAQRIVNWLRDDALPLWSSEAGWDQTHGGCVESLDLSGAANLEVNKRVRVQARQLYVYSHAQLLGFDGADTETDRILTYLLSHASDHARGGWVHLLSPDGTVADARRDMYDQAFVLHGLAWAVRATGNDQIKEHIDATLMFVDAQLRHNSQGGYVESDLQELPRRQNPHMHWLEALLALYEATGDDHLIGRADSIVDLFRTFFFDNATGTLGEYFQDDWQVVPGPEGQVVEPGHHFEWVWLLHKYRRLGGRHSVKEHAKRLYDFACARGLDPKTGFAVDEVNRAGRVVRASRRCWPQTEALKAHITAARWWDAETSDKVEGLVAGLFDTYLNVTPPGGWQDQFDESGAPMATSMPASSLYHLMLAFAETLDFCDS